jgi:gas vesicle protein
MRGLGKFLLGAVIGACVGSAIALYFAPVPGSLLRERVYDYFTNIRDDVKNAASNKRQELTQELLVRQHKI